MKKSKSLVLFDIGGVLLELDYRKFYREAAHLAGISPEQFKTLYIESRLEERALRGEIEDTQSLTEIQQLISPYKDISEAQLKSLSGTNFKGQADEVVELKRKIHEAGHPIGLFSNINSHAIDIISAKWPKIYETFGGPAIYSHQIGSIKPELPMYKAVEKLSYNKVIFIDDKESYLQTGIENFGWYGILFTPFIDKAEAIRSIHTDETKPIRNFKTANSISELETALREFGVEI